MGFKPSLKKYPLHPHPLSGYRGEHEHCDGEKGPERRLRLQQVHAGGRTFTQAWFMGED